MGFFNCDCIDSLLVRTFLIALIPGFPTKEKLNVSFAITHKDVPYITQDGISEDISQGQTEMKINVGI